MTELDIELKSAWGGWSQHWTPDDLTVIFRASSEEVKKYASLTAIMEAYGCLLNQTNCDIVTGSNTAIGIEFIDDDLVEFNVPPLGTNVIAAEEIKNVFESFLSDIFKLYDERNGQEGRREALDNIQDDLKEKGVGYNVDEVYRRLSDG